MDMVDAFKNLSTPCVSDTQQTSGAMDAGIRPLDRRMGVAGPAFTCRCVPGDNLALHKAIALAQPGAVLVVSCGGNMDCSVFGQMLALSCRSRGVAGVVVDGCVRDSLELVEMGFPTYCRGTHPRGPTRGSTDGVGEPVLCGGVTVHTGDIIVADGDGVVVVKPEQAQEVLSKATAKAAREEQLQSMLTEGNTTWNLLGLSEKYS